MSQKAKYKALKEKVAAARKEMEAAAKDAFSEGCQELFAAHPELTSFAWKQYTPHFNDGDACEFGAHVDDPYVNGMNEYGDSIDDEEVEQSSEEEKSHRKLCKTVAEFLKMLCDDDYKALFGDHVSVRVTRDKVEVEEYSHD